MNSMPHTKRLSALGTAVLALAITTKAMAAAPDADTVAKQMKQALEPAQSSLRKVTLAVSQDGETREVMLGEARGRAGAESHILVVVLAPQDLRGTAFLVKEEPAGMNDTTWMYIPAVRRVRKLVSPEAYSAFLNSDFTYSDLGFVNTRPSVSMQSEETRSGAARAYLLRAVPKESWYYSKIETTVAADSYLPIERHYFDPAGALWKVERWDGVAVINGVPTALRATIDDVQYKSQSSLKVTDLQYGAQVPETLFQPDNLPEAVSSPVWSKLAAPVGR